MDFLAIAANKEDDNVTIELDTSVHLFHLLGMLNYDIYPELKFKVEEILNKEELSMIRPYTFEEVTEEDEEFKPEFKQINKLNYI